MESEVERLIEQVTSLPSDQQRRFRELLASNTSRPPEQSREDDFKQQLLRSGLLREIEHPVQTGTSSRQPRADIQCEPLSETVVQERR